MEDELLQELKQIKNKNDLKNAIDKAILNGYDILFLDDRYCPKIDTKNYDIIADDSDLIMIYAPNPRPYKRHYKNFYKSFKFIKAKPIAHDIIENKPVYNIKNNLIIY